MIPDNIYACEWCGYTFLRNRKGRVTCTQSCLDAMNGNICSICGEGHRSSLTSSKPSRKGHASCYRSQGVERYCGYRKCRKAFWANHTTQIYCTKSCAIQESQYRKGKPCRVCGEAVAQQVKGSNEPTHLNCMTPAPKRSKTTYIRRMSKRLRDEVLARDNMICQICLMPCDRAGGRLDDIYPTIDHIVPLVEFLDLPREEAITQANNLANLRTAHRVCNLKKNKKLDQAKEYK